MNYGIDFSGGSSIEVQGQGRRRRSGRCARRARATQPRRRPGAGIRHSARSADPHRGAGGRRQRRAVGASTRCRSALGEPTTSSAASKWSGRPFRANWPGTAPSACWPRMLAMLIYIWFRFEWQFARRRRHRHAARRDHDGRASSSGSGIEFNLTVDRGDPDHRRLFAQRHGRRVRPRSRESAQIQEDADRATARPVDEPDAVAHDPDRRDDAAGAAGALSVRRRGHPLVHLRDDLRHPGRHLFVDLRRRAAADPVQAAAGSSATKDDGKARLPATAQPSKT